jgi:hypothetical protein
MDRKKVLMLVAVLVCLPFAGEAFGQCSGGTCRPVQKAVTKTLEGVKSVVARPVVNRAVVKHVARRGIVRRIFSRR